MTNQRYPIQGSQRVVLGPTAIPALRIAPFLREAASRTFPALILQHGYGADKYDLEPIGEELATAGAVVYLPDAWGHGERFDPRGQNFMRDASSDYFIAVVRQVMADLRALLPVVSADPAVAGAPVWLGGFSLGGIATLLTLESDSEVAGGIVFSGGISPEVVSAPLGMAPASLDNQAWARAHDMASSASVAALAQRPLFLTHGQADDRLPVIGTTRLYAAAQPLYRAMPERLQLRLFAGGHMIPPALLEDAVAWFTDQIAPPHSP